MITRMRRRIIRLCIAGLLLLAPAATARDSSKFPFDAFPLPTELLKEFITLDCGLQLVESRPRVPTADELKRMNVACSKAKKYFWRYLQNRWGIKEKGAEPHLRWWRLAILPFDRKPRSFHDFKERFYPVAPRYTATGMTIAARQYSFLPARMDQDVFISSLIHEAFHALSHRTGFRKTHGTAAEEEMAAEFATYLRWQP